LYFPSSRREEENSRRKKKRGGHSIFAVSNAILPDELEIVEYLRILLPIAELLLNFTKIYVIS
jgi:hypothetical protein